MKINNETKVGVLAVAAILALILGFNFLKGKSVFSKTPVIYAVFSELGALEKSNQVKINGLSVGTVYNFVPVDKEVNGIVVEIHLNRDIAIPANSTAFIDGALVGSSYISIEKGTAKAYLQSGDTINTRLDVGLMNNIKTQLTPTITRVNETLDSLKLAVGAISSIFDPNTNNNLRTMIAHLTITSAHLQELLNAQSGSLAQSLGNINSLTDNLAKNNDAISASIRNIEATTGNLANAPIQQTVAGLHDAVTDMQGTITQLRGAVSQINSPNGTLGLLVNDTRLYKQLNSAALGLEILLDDVRLHPKRYVNISVFGGKSKGGAITSPAVKDTTPVRYNP